MADTTSMPVSPLLSMPPELRNAIYDLLYTTPSPYRPPPKASKNPQAPSALADFGRMSPLDELPAEASNRHLCGLVRSCKQIHKEANLIFLSRTSFNLSGPYATPEYFNRLVAPLSAEQIKHIRHITLTGRINVLRTLNETWNGAPFNHPLLSLSTLTIIPRRPQNHGTQYAEIADLSQAHTLAYILAETLKSLKGIERIIVRNDDNCFNKVVWKLVYRSLVYRLWRWGGFNLGLKFRQDPSERNAWFEVSMLSYDPAGDGWCDPHLEVQRMTGLENEASGT